MATVSSLPTTICDLDIAQEIETGPQSQSQYVIFTDNKLYRSSTGPRIGGATGLSIVLFDSLGASIANPDDGSIAIGCLSRSAGTGSIAIGFDSDAYIATQPDPDIPSEFEDDRTLFSTGTGPCSIAIGTSAYATSYGTALGLRAGATGTNGIAVGPGAAAGTNGIAIGSGNPSALPVCSMSIGRESRASKDYASAIGFRSDCNGGNSIAFGTYSCATGNNSVAIGNACNSANDSVALGASANAFSQTVALGPRATTKASSSVALGMLSSTTNGWSCAVGHSAECVGSYSTAVGYNARSYGSNSVAVGIGATATGANASACGRDAQGNGPNSASFGYLATSGNYACAFGNKASATGSNAVAIGSVSVGQAANTVAVGNGVKSLGIGACALGNTASAERDNACAIGPGTRALGIRSIALGFNAGATGMADNSFYTITNMAPVDNGVSLAYDITTGQIGPAQPSPTTLLTEITEVADQDMTAIVSALTPVTFALASEPTRREFGLVAEDVAAICPSLVVLDSNGQPYAVDYAKLSVVLLGALKDILSRT